MHEWALAAGVIDTATELARKERFLRLTRVVVRIGELQRIEPEVFRQALETMRPGDDPRLASTDFELQLEPAGFACRKCGHEFARGAVGAGLDPERLEAIHFIPELAHAFLRCPRCASPDFEVRRGRGLSLETIEGER